MTKTLLPGTGSKKNSKQLIRLISDKMNLSKDKIMKQRKEYMLWLQSCTSLCLCVSRDTTGPLVT